MVGFSFGGGVQSWAIVALIHSGKISPPDLIVFSNVGGEDPATLTYLHNHRPLISEIAEFVEVRPGDFDAGVQQGLYRDLLDTGKIRIPAIMRGTNGARMNRTCTNEWKIRQVRRVLRGTSRTDWNLWLGYSMDEADRMKQPRDVKWLTHSFPLIDFGMNRRDCLATIKDFGLLEPPPSRCFFCPFKTALDWHQEREQRPAIYQATRDLEKRLNEDRPGDPIKIMSHDERQGLLPLCESSCWT